MSQKCAICTKMCRPVDSWRPFGSKNYENLEPLDESYCCKKCWPKLKTKWLSRLTWDSQQGDWEKSRAEMEAAKELGLAWVGSGGVGMLGTEVFANSYQYIPQAKYNRLSKLPYYGYCPECASKRKGGYCSNRKCSESFKALTQKSK